MRGHARCGSAERWFLVSALLGVTLGVGGATADTGAATAPPAEVQVRRTVVRFYAAVHRRDGRTACTLMTGRLRREVVSIDPPPGRRRSCPTALVAQYGGQKPPRIVAIRAKGRTASARVTDGDDSGSVNLVRGPTGWRMDDL